MLKPKINRSGRLNLGLNYSGDLEFPNLIEAQINSFDVTSKINFLECLRNEDILAQEEFEVLYQN